MAGSTLSLSFSEKLHQGISISTTCTHYGCADATDHNARFARFLWVVAISLPSAGTDYHLKKGPHMRRHFAILVFGLAAASYARGVPAQQPGPLECNGDGLTYRFTAPGTYVVTLAPGWNVGNRQSVSLCSGSLCWEGLTHGGNGGSYTFNISAGGASLTLWQSLGGPAAQSQSGCANGFFSAAAFHADNLHYTFNVRRQ